jgi:hypothetical protein
MLEGGCGKVCDGCGNVGYLGVFLDPQNMQGHRKTRIGSDFTGPVTFTHDCRTEVLSESPEVDYEDPANILSTVLVVRCSHSLDTNVGRGGPHEYALTRCGQNRAKLRAR